MKRLKLLDMLVSTADSCLDVSNALRSFEITTSLQSMLYMLRQGGATPIDHMHVAATGVKMLDWSIFGLDRSLKPTLTF